MILGRFLRPIDDLLRREGIPYAVIGGYAVAAWGEVRATRDIDLLCNADDLARLTRALRGAEIGFDHRIGDADDPISDVVRIEVGTAGVPYEVDVLCGIRGSPPGIVERARMVQIEGLPVPVAAPEDTLILKLLAGSARDLEDAVGIVRHQKSRLDMTLLERLCPAELTDSMRRVLALAGEEQV